MVRAKPKQIGLKPLDICAHEDTLQDFEAILGFPCEGVVDAWGWKNKKSEFVTEAFLGKSQAFLKVIETAKKLKGIPSPILIMGESGTGKELLAHFIHQLEEGPKRPFIAVNCGAIPENLIESELFGHEKGAFTGAIARKVGYFEMANGGDIFLDEISTLKPDLQVKLLRVLQDKTVQRVGGKDKIQLDFRVIAATNEKLKELVEKGLFRLDLYHRLSVVPLHMPPLRERFEDIPLLIDYFRHKFSKPGDEIKISTEAQDLLMGYTWPGNIRELENVIHQLSVLFAGKTITEKDIAAVLQGDNRNSKIFLTKATLKDHLSESEKGAILNVLERKRWNVSAAAKTLRISRTTLYKKIKGYHLSKV